MVGSGEFSQLPLHHLYLYLKGFIHTYADFRKCADFKDFFQLFLLLFMKKQEQNESIYRWYHAQNA